MPVEIFCSFHLTSVLLSCRTLSMFHTSPLLVVASLLILSGCGALCFECIPIPRLNPNECGCPDGSTRIKITIEHGAVLCLKPDEEMSGDVWPTCISDSSVQDTNCKVVEDPPYYSEEKVVCP
jgi:hypothetical protein